MARLSLVLLDEQTPKGLRVEVDFVRLTSGEHEQRVQGHVGIAHGTEGHSSRGAQRQPRPQQHGVITMVVLAVAGDQGGQIKEQLRLGLSTHIEEACP
eukprot:5626672-Amphidinium_carterae.2